MSYIQIHRSKTPFNNQESLNSLTKCSKFRPKSIGKKFHKSSTKQKTRKITSIPILDVQGYHEAKSIQNPMTPKPFPCSGASTDSPYHQRDMSSSKHEVTGKILLTVQWRSKKRYAPENKAYFQQKMDQ